MTTIAEVQEPCPYCDRTHPGRCIAEIRTHITQRRLQVVELTQTGLSLKDIAEQLGVTERTVERDREAEGITTQIHQPWTTEQHHQAMKLICDGASLREVADTVGHSYHSVCYRFRHMGWTCAQTGAHNRLSALKRALGV